MINIIDFTESYKNIHDDFILRNIPCDQPGFYDHPNFIEVERNNSDYLNNYARYVQTRNFEHAYLERARTEIPIIARVLFNELKKDGRKGACIDMSNVLSRILDREGYWNFAIKGSLTIDYPCDSGIDKKYFWSVDQGEFNAGHAWVYAPPFGVVDITIRQQEYGTSEYKLLPNYIITESMNISEYMTEDIISPEIRMYLHTQGIPLRQQLNYVNSTMVKFLNTFETYKVQSNEIQLKYIPVAIGASDVPLDSMIGISIEGRSAIDIYTELVIPELNKHRIA